MLRLRMATAVLGAALGVNAAMAGGIEALDAFVKHVKSGRATFTQTVTAPAKDGQAVRPKVSSGSFEFVRPNRFKFIYKKPFEQSIIADGQTLWLYDVDLAQVTARKQAAALGSTPAALISAAPDLKALQAEYILSDAPASDGQEWLLATPKPKEGSLQSVRVGFKDSMLVTLEILDSFGQRSVLHFNAFEANAVIEPSSFQFKPPAGVDVVRQ
ncbi:MAG: outer membrane lipoprotein chaperone LolA [Rhodoferax sp.]